MMGTKKPLCNEDCFHCVHPDCIVDETPSEAKARRNRESCHKYYVAHKDRLAAKKKEYRATHRDEINAYRRAYYRKKREEAAANAR